MTEVLNHETQALRDDESPEYLEACFQIGVNLSEQQYTILYENNLDKLQRIAKRKDRSFPKVK